MYSNANRTIELVTLRHKDNVTKCRIFEISGDSPVLLRIPDLEVLGILKIECNMLCNPNFFSSRIISILI